MTGRAVHGLRDARGGGGPPPALGAVPEGKHAVIGAAAGPAAAPLTKPAAQIAERRLSSM
jgi:hypothetical protein